MRCSKCGRTLHKVMETRTVHDEFVNRRSRSCPIGHRETTYEISLKMWNAAKSDIKRTIKKQAYNIKIEQLRVQKAQMLKERLAGASCPELAVKYQMSVHMARYYTRLPRSKLYPAAKHENAM